MAELSGAARAELGKSRVSGTLDIRMTTVLIGLALVGAAVLLSMAASGATPRRLFWVHRTTEWEAPVQDFHDHLATAAELLAKPVFVPVVFPDRTAPGITSTMHRGFRTATWQASDPAVEHNVQTEPW